MIVLEAVQCVASIRPKILAFQFGNSCKFLYEYLVCTRYSTCMYWWLSLTTVQYLQPFLAVQSFLQVWSWGFMGRRKRQCGICFCNRFGSFHFITVPDKNNHSERLIRDARKPFHIITAPGVEIHMIHFSTAHKIRWTLFSQESPFPTATWRFETSLAPRN